MFHLGAHSAITSRHYFACSGGVRIGIYTSIGGVRSTFITHQISWKSSDQTFRPIEIGDYCLITSNVQVAPGSIVGNRIVVGMGATIAGRLGPGVVHSIPRDTSEVGPGRRVLPKRGRAYRHHSGTRMKRDRPYRPTRIKTQLAGLTLIRD